MFRHNGDFIVDKLGNCLTLYDMKTSTLTIRLDKDLDDLLTKASRRSGRNRSEIAREALRRQLRISVKPDAANPAAQGERRSYEYLEE
jgi:hypothetical protein